VEFPFKYVGGDPALDLVNTVDWTSSGLRDERLGDYDRLTRWAEGAGVLSPKAAAVLRREAAGSRNEAESAYRGALRVREILQHLFSEISQGAASADTVAEFNRVLSPALRKLRVMSPARSGERLPRLELGWDEQETRLDSVMWPVLWSAASLVGSEEVSRVRVCGGAECGWMYVDRSRNGLRRWCQMESCGTREKTRRRRHGLRAERR
jgi:predicted RNA-binding Zn ribbon-like protein